MFKFLNRNHVAQQNTLDSGDEPLIVLRDIKKVYKTEAGDFLALKGIDLSIEKGELVGIIGKSGSGKSTLVNMITGIDRPTSGEVYINGTAVHHFSEDQMAKWRGVNMGVVFQFFQLLPTLTVVENVMLPMDFCNQYSPRERVERAMALLEMVDVAEQANKLPTMISGGQQQRVAIARALANDPPIVVADEPTGNLDSRTANQVFKMFESLVAAGKTFLMVTHDNELSRRMKRVIMIVDGKLINETLVHVLPTLPYDTLLEAHYQLRSLTVEPGADVDNAADAPRQFYMIADGNVRLQTAAGETVVELGPGQFFGATPLQSDDDFTARVTSDTPAKLYALDTDHLAGYLDSSEDTRTLLREELAHRRTPVTEGE